MIVPTLNSLFMKWHEKKHTKRKILVLKTNIWTNSYRFIRNIGLHPGTGLMHYKTLMHFTTVNTIMTAMDKLVVKTGVIIFYVP